MKCLMTVFVALMAMSVLAQAPERRGPGSMEPVLRAALNPKLAEKLGVTEEQAAKLKALADEKGNQRELNEKIRKGMERQAELLKAEKIDEAAVMAVLDEVWAARKEIAKRQTKRVIAVRSILTSEQVKQAVEAVKTMRDGHRKGPKGEAKGRKCRKETPEA